MGCNGSSITNLICNGKSVATYFLFISGICLTMKNPLLNKIPVAICAADFCRCKEAPFLAVKALWKAFLLATSLAVNLTPLDLSIVNNPR